VTAAGDGGVLPVRGHADFSRLWTGLAVSQFGSTIGMVALPVVAVVVLGASVLQVALLSAITSVTVALLAFPLGSVVEHRRKRPVMITADCLRFLSLGSVPLAGALGILTFTQLCVVGALNAVGQITRTRQSTLRPANRSAWSCPHAVGTWRCCSHDAVHSTTCPMPT
jgi:MFS family permease